MLVPTTTQDTVAPLPPEGGVIGGVVLCRVLVFLSALLQDLSKLMEYRRVSSMDPSHISVGTRCVVDVTAMLVVLSCAGTSFGSGRTLSGEDLESLHPPHSNVG